MNGFTLLDQLFAPGDPQNRLYGVMIGIVTDNKDPEDLGRVKVKFPWLTDQEASNWARVAASMAGKQRGLYFLPEVDDEVLVAFEHGDVRFPYILGGLWNGKDAPPVKNGDGKNNLRVIKSRSGHTITLDDTDGSEKISIADKTGKNEIVIDSKENSLTLRVEGDFAVEAKGNIILKCTGKLTLEAGQDASLAGAELKMEAKGKAGLKGTQLALEGSAKTEVKSAGIVQVQGGLVKIN